MRIPRNPKQYKLTNHLGNVLSTVLDRKTPITATGGSGSSTTITHYEGDVVFATDYYPFGSPRSWSTPDSSGGRMNSGAGYRYGFNGQEKEPELGDSYAFEYRIHDSRLGRFLSVDPLKSDYPWNSTYAFAENRVIDGIDLEGLEYLSVKNANIPKNAISVGTDGRTNLNLGNGVTFNSVSTVKINNQSYYKIGKHLTYSENNWSIGGPKANQQTVATKVGQELISSIDNLPRRPANVWTPNYSTEITAEIELSQKQALYYNNPDGVCYAVTESRANQAYVDQFGENAVNLTVSNKNPDHRLASSQGTKDKYMGYGAGAPFLRHGLGVAVNNSEVWSGKLETGALLQLWNSSDVNSTANLMRSGGHSMIFRNYTFNSKGVITGMEVTDNSGGKNTISRTEYEKAKTFLGVNLLDKR